MAIQKIKLKIGTVYQKEPNGVYYFRYQVNGARKAISLKTRNKQEAVKEAEKHVHLLQATLSEVIAAHVQYARNLAPPEKNLLLSQAWNEYEKTPDRATPATVSANRSETSNTFLQLCPTLGVHINTQYSQHWKKSSRNSSVTHPSASTAIRSNSLP